MKQLVLIHVLLVVFAVVTVAACEAITYGSHLLPNHGRKLLSSTPNDVKSAVSLAIDTAQLNIISRCYQNITLSIVTSECHMCKYRQLAVMVPFVWDTVVVETRYSSMIEVTVQALPKPQILCKEKIHFAQYGNYTYYISPNSTWDYESKYICVMSSEDPPPDVNIPVYVAIAILFGVGLAWTVALSVCRHRNWYARFCLRSERLINDDLGLPSSASNSHSPGPTRRFSTDQTCLPSDLNGGPVLGCGLPSPDVSVVVRPPQHAPESQRRRLKSLDTFRGLSIVIMIFVNYGGGEYKFFRHSPWNGLTLADVVFPWFIFIMGTSMVYSHGGQLRRNTPREYIFLKIIKRSAILVILGLILNSSPHCPNKETHMQYFRIPGVLQRFGVTYYIVASVYLLFARVQTRHSGGIGRFLFDDVIEYWLEWVIHLCLLAIYLGMTFALPVPGCPTGYLGPGGMADQGQYENCTGGAAGYIDRLIFGVNHIYKHPTSEHVYYSTVPYDPEGLLGCLTSVFLCFLGLQAGKILLLYNGWKQVISKWLLWAVWTGIIAILLCQARKEDGWIPINKNLWSLSYVLLMAASSFLLLVLLYTFIDELQWWSGEPFIYPGMNAILLYMGHEMFRYYLPISFHVVNTHAAHLAMDLWGAVFWVIVAYVLHKKRIYLAI